MVDDIYIMSSKYRLPVTFDQNWPMQQSHGLFATAKLFDNFVFVSEVFFWRMSEQFSLPFCHYFLTLCMRLANNLLGGTILPRFLLQKLVASACVSHCQLTTIKWPTRQYTVNIQRFEHDMVSIRSRWQGRHGAWLIDTPSQMDWLPAAQRDCNHPTVAIWFRVRTPSKTRGYRFLHLSSTPCHTRGYR